MSATSGPRTSVIFSAPTTSTTFERPAAIEFRPWCNAAEPVAQAFSTRVDGVKRISSEACSGSEDRKRSFTNPSPK